MAWTPISGSMIQYQTSDGSLASGYFLKMYQSGTTTAFSMATDSTGGTTLDKCQLDSSGYPTTDGSTRFIPHVNQKYKIVLYKNSTDADANTTGNADWVINAVEQFNTISNSEIIFETVAAMVASTTLSIGDHVRTLGYTAIGDGGGNEYDIVAAATGTDDGGSYINLATHQAKGLFPGGEYKIRQWGVASDDSTDDRAKIESASDFTAGKSLDFQDVTCYVTGTGVTLTGNNHKWFSNQGAQLRCERTYYVDQGAGVYTVGQGNIVNGSSITGVSIKGITFKGAYDTAWGDQDIYANNATWESASKLLFLLNCNDVVLDGFKIIESYSSYSPPPAGVEPTSIYGWNQILLSGCDGVDLINCQWTDSVGEAWNIYNCNNVNVRGCNFENDYGVSWLDITYCTKVKVKNNSFLKLLESDSGDLLNVICSDGIISGNTLLNGNIDVGNEYLNRGFALGQSFVCANVEVLGNTITNGFIQFGTTDDTFTPTWAHENIDISNNTITIDLDTRPAANGTTVLNYSAVTLPQYKNSRNINITNNTIILKGALQTGGTPSNLNNVRLINSITDTTGYTRKNFSIEGNTITCEFSNYNPDNINNLGGAIVIQRGIWEDLSIEGNVIDSYLGMMIDRHESIDRCTIKNNTVTAENFLNMPFTTDTDIDGFDINDNSFVFKNTSGHNYDSTDIDSRGFGAFINLWGGASTTIEKFQVKNNNVEAVVFVLCTNFNTTTAFTVNGVISDNQVNFKDFLATTGSPNIYPFHFGRQISGTAPSTLHLKDNYFFEDSASTVAFECKDVKALDFIENQFIGNYSFTITTDNISGVSSSRFIMKDNLATASLTVSQGNMTTAVLQEISNNSTNFSFGGYSKINAVTVASLQSASTAGEGARAFVTDANATTFASVVAGSGSNNVPVYSDGTDWRIG